MRVRPNGARLGTAFLGLLVGRVPLLTDADTVERASAAARGVIRVAAGIRVPGASAPVAELADRLDGAPTAACAAGVDVR